MNARIPLLLCVWTLLSFQGKSYLSFQGKTLVRVGSRDWRSTFSCKATLKSKRRYMQFIISYTQLDTCISIM